MTALREKVGTGFRKSDATNKEKKMAFVDERILL
jgi:hypothetical protein